MFSFTIKEKIIVLMRGCYRRRAEGKQTRLYNRKL